MSFKMGVQFAVPPSVGFRKRYCIKLVAKVLRLNYTNNVKLDQIDVR